MPILCPHCETQIDVPPCRAGKGLRFPRFHGIFSLHGQAGSLPPRPIGRYLFADGAGHIVWRS